MPLNFDPPLLNSATAWATTAADLQTLYDSPYTGAITTRTSTLHGFDQDDAKHQYRFLDPQSYDVSHHSGGTSASTEKLSSARQSKPTSLNTYGYSPLPFPTYLSIATALLTRPSPSPSAIPKPIIFSITGPPSEIISCYILLSQLTHNLRTNHSIHPRFLLEINLSCPNIPGAPPPAYSALQIGKYVTALQQHGDSIPEEERVECGIKTPPFTYGGQFEGFVAGLLSCTSTTTHPITFLTATNTLGSCLFPPCSSTSPSASSSTSTPSLSGLAGLSLHPLSLGNVSTLRTLLLSYPSLAHIEIIGVGGVSDAGGYERMKGAGASAVGVGTGLGVGGVGVFEGISKGRTEGRGEGLWSKL